MAQPSSIKGKRWTERISRSGYFVGALLLHLVVFILVATWVVFPALQQPTSDFSLHYLPPPKSPPPVQPPPTEPTQPSADISANVSPTPAPPIITSGKDQPLNLPMPKIGSGTIPGEGPHLLPPHISTPPHGISPDRLPKIKDFIKLHRQDNPLYSRRDPHNVIVKFPVYLASYADGDWNCNVHMKDGKIDAGSLPNLIAKVSEWSHGNIKAEVEPTPLNIGGPDLLEKKPPFIFFTGHKDFVLTGQEVKNLQDYVEMGGLIWGDNAEAGRGSRFDVAFRREMKRVVPDLDKNFEPVDMTDDIFTKSWYPISKLPQGMNYYAQPLEHLDIDGKMAILYTPNDYSDMFSMRIKPGDDEMVGEFPDLASKSPLFTSPTFLYNRGIFFRNFDLSNCLATQRLGMNIIGYLLVRFDNDLLLTP